ncbi:MAG: hypothetical protein Q9210_001263 [Variospora velana]
MAGHLKIRDVQGLQADINEEWIRKSSQPDYVGGFFPFVVDQDLYHYTDRLSRSKHQSDDADASGLESDLQHGADGWAYASEAEAAPQQCVGADEVATVRPVQRRLGILHGDDA